jgi:hypothetical protein
MKEDDSVMRLMQYNEYIYSYLSIIYIINSYYKYESIIVYYNALSAMKKLTSIAVMLVLASGLSLASIGNIVPVVAQTTSDTNTTNATSTSGGNTTDGNNSGNPLSKVPIIGGLLGGGGDGGNNTGGNNTGGNNSGNPLSKVPIIGGLLGGK